MDYNDKDSFFGSDEDDFNDIKKLHEGNSEEKIFISDEDYKKTINEIEKNHNSKEYLERIERTKNKQNQKINEFEIDDDDFIDDDLFGDDDLSDGDKEKEQKGILDLKGFNNNQINYKEKVEKLNKEILKETNKLSLNINFKSVKDYNNKTFSDSLSENQKIKNENILNKNQEKIKTKEENMKLNNSFSLKPEILLSENEEARIIENNNTESLKKRIKNNELNNNKMETAKNRIGNIKFEVLNMDFEKTVNIKASLESFLF